MSQLSQLVRHVQAGLWPRRRVPFFKKWNRGAERPRGVASSRVYSADELTIDDFFQAPVYGDRVDHLFHAFGHAPSLGHVMEFGVFQAGTLNWMAQWSRRRPDPRVFGFDSFQGLPHDWVRTKDGGDRYQAGHFALPALPCVKPNARLVPGFFDATLAPWLAENPGPVALLHNDSDLYSSTIHTLRLLNDRIVPGTVIVFDELCSWIGSATFDNWEEGEWRALREWMAQFHRRIAILSRDSCTATAIRVVS